MTKPWVLTAIISALILIVVALAFGTSKGMSLEERQRIFEKSVIDFERLCIDPEDPLITNAEINRLRERMGFEALPEGALQKIRIRMGIPDPPSR